MSDGKADSEFPGSMVTWDAGHQGCGELILELRTRVRQLQQGQRLRLLAFDQAAPEEIPAWCRLTGHRLIRQEHPEYLIERKEG